jgi:hypothetical protein
MPGQDRRPAPPAERPNGRRAQAAPSTSAPVACAQPSGRRPRPALEGIAIALVALALPGLALAQRWEPQRVAELQALDKVTARVSTLRVPVNQPASFGTLTVTVRSCQARPADEVPDASAWLEIADSRPPANGASVFRGWMFANAPGVNMMQHPVYDIRLMECRAQ